MGRLNRIASRSSPADSRSDAHSVACRQLQLDWLNPSVATRLWTRYGHIAAQRPSSGHDGLRPRRGALRPTDRDLQRHRNNDRRAWEPICNAPGRWTRPYRGWLRLLDGSTILASAELYDPGTGAFIATGAMIAPRSANTATLLNDGRVLMAGGITNPVASTDDVVVLAAYHEGLVADTDASTTLATAELYDPSTGTFASTGSMADFRSNFTATLLQDGRVLVAGGGGETYNRNSAELYDPTAGTFSPTGSMVKARRLQTATLLDDGRVLITGGRSPNDATYASAEVYDPQSGSFIATGQMGASRQQFTATLLQDGHVLIAGGYTGDSKGNWNVLASTEIYDPVSGKFLSSGSMGDAREGGVAVRLPDGSVLICGGEGIGTDSLIWLSSAVLYQ